jgi:hyaluronoglucosaminidase
MKRLLFFILLVAGALNSAAQTVTISPLPQKVTWGECAFANDAQFYIVGANTADVDAVNVLTEKLNIVGVSDKVNAKKFPQAKPVIIGDVQDKAVAKYKKLVPEAAEGYYINVSADQVVIAGRDNSGTFYGVQSFIQVMSSPKVMQCEISDYPSVTERGVIEGFYGNPWSHADRLRQFDFYGKNKLNIYVYGPKDDPYHRSHWRQPYPEKEAAQLKELVDAAHKNKVKFVWAIHPACDIKWGMEDYNNIVNKLNLMYEIGVRTFAVFFDDVSGEGARADMQTDVMNYLTDEFVRKHSDVEPLVMCPSQYNKNWSGGDYLSTLSKMYPEIRVMWTGNSVVDMIGENDMQWINDQIKRKAFIWLNYPVNDYCQSRLLMGKTYGNDLNINHMVSGFCSNPMEYAEASKVSLYSIADYAWNMPSYNSETSWERALKELMPTSHEAFRIFCENNVDLGVTYHGLRRDGESPKFDSKSFETLSDSFAELVWAADNLLADEVNSPEMLAEIRPWVESMRLLGVRGQMYLNMVKDLENKDSVAFVGHYKALTKLTQQQKAIVSRDYEGSIVKAKPVVSGDVITPWILDNVDELIKTYKANYSYCAEIFPVNAIEDGVYFIKVNGEYLTNVNAGPDKAGDYPVFVAERDNINPQRQEWVIEHNNITGRYKIYNKQDGRYINEAGAFWRSTKYVFHHDWNTYNLVKVGDRWSIQNGGRAGEKYWKRSGDRITGNGTEDYIFEIEKIN